MKIVFATGNVGKLREASEILGEGFELVSLADVGILEDIPETGNTLRANSLQKAQYLYEKLGCNCFADDTGLEVDALGGAPGVYTARYAGDDKDFNKNMDKVLYELARLQNESKVAASLGHILIEVLVISSVSCCIYSWSTAKSIDFKSCIICKTVTSAFFQYILRLLK